MTQAGFLAFGRSGISRIRVVLVVALVAIATVGAGAYLLYYSNSGKVAYQGGQAFATTENEAMMMGSAPTYATVITSNNTIVFHSSDIRLTAMGRMSGMLDMFNISMQSVPSYVQQGSPVFVIYGLVEPTLVVPQSARVNITFINMDGDMVHNFVLTNTAPPYPTSMGSNSLLTQMDFVQPTSDGSAHGYWYAATLPAGTYYYLCEAPGHASTGMYGRIIAR